MPVVPSNDRSTNRPIPTLRESVRYLRRMVTLMRPYWGFLAKGTAMSVCIGVVGMVAPFVSKLFFDKVYPARDVSLMQILVLTTFVLTMTSSVMNAIKSFYSTTISAQLNRSMSLMYFNHLQHLTVRFFDEHRVGEVYSRFGNVASSIRTVTGILETVMLNGTFLVLVPPLLLFMNFKLALLSFFTIPLTTAVSTYSSRWARKFSQQGMEASSELTAFQFETLSHIRAVKGLAAEHFVFRSAKDQLHKTMELQLKGGALSLGVGLVNTLLKAAGAAAFSYVAWSQIITEQMTLGDFMAFSMYIGYLTGPIGSFASMFLDFQTSAVNFGRMFEYLDLPVEQDPTQAFLPQKPIQQRLRGDISLENVHFGYTSEKPVLTGVSLRIERGSLNAVVGPSGAGKSSFLRLLCGMERPDSGSICFDQVAINRIALSDLRRQIAVVWQEFSLMRGTIRENLTYALDSVADNRIDDAIRMCHLTDVISALPNGLETTVAEWGATLSGGQRQRLALARALIRDTPILLLDEATSNIDVNTESEILRDVFSVVRQSKTVLYVTHRVSTATMADRIFVMNHGALVGTGTHAALMESCEVYASLQMTGAGRTEDLRKLRMVSGEGALQLR